MTARFSAETVRPFLPRESMLRDRALCNLNVATPHQLQEVIALFSINGLRVDPQALVELLRISLRQAQRSESWGNGEIVNIGYYSTDGDYYTILFHELGHRLLRSLGRTAGIYNINPSPEEFFCWDFSRKACSALELPYSPVRELTEKLGFLLADAVANHNTPIILVLLEIYARAEAQLYGLTRYSRNRLDWDGEERPVEIKIA
jgi:hypothetical protein